MITGIYRVLGCSDLIQVPSQKADGGFICKKFVRLQEFGGWNSNDTADRLSNSILATMIGNLAQCNFYQNDLVALSYRTSLREYQGNWYQDNTIVEIRKID